MVGEDYKVSDPLLRPFDIVDSSLWITISTDGGSTFTTRSIVSTTTEGVSFTRPSVAADPRDTKPNVYVSWTRSDSNGQAIWVAVSRDGGQTFPEIQAISDPYVSGAPPFANDFGELSSTGHVGINGTYYVVWFQPDNDYFQPPDDFYVMRRHLDGTAVYDPPVTSPPRIIAELIGLSNPGNSIFNEPFHVGSAMTVNSADGLNYFRDVASITSGRWECTKDDVYVAYAADDNVPQVIETNANVYVVDSLDGGQSWGTPTRAHFDNPPAPGHSSITFGEPSEYFPTIATADSGHIALTFITARDDVLFTDSTPGIANQDYIPYFKYSGDLGRTFVTEFPIEDFSAPGFRIPLARQSDDREPTGNNPFYEFTLFSERAALAMHGRTFRPTWMTLRNWVLPVDDPLNWVYTRSQTNQTVGDILSAGVEMQVHVRPDFDGDCDVDLGDFSIFSLCFGGTGNPPAPECPPGIDADLDGDGDVDQGDFAEFSLCFGGPKNGCAGAAACGEGESAAPTGGQSASAPELPANNSVIPDDPEVLEMYRELEEYCRVNGIPFG